MSKYSMVDLDGKDLGTLDSGSNTVKDSKGNVIYRVKGKYLIPEEDNDEVCTISSDGRVANEDGNQIGFIYNYKDFKSDQATKKSSTKTSSSNPKQSSNSSSKTSTTTKSSTTTAKPKQSTSSTTPKSTPSTTTSKSSLSGWLWFIGIVIILIWLFAPKNIVGTWKLTKVEFEGKTYTAEEYEEKINGEHHYASPYYYELNFRKDGGFTEIEKSKQHGAETAKGTWYESDKGVYKVTAKASPMDYDETIEIKRDGKYLVLKVNKKLTLYFKKG